LYERLYALYKTNCYKHTLESDEANNSSANRLPKQLEAVQKTSEYFKSVTYKLQHHSG